MAEDIRIIKSSLYKLFQDGIDPSIIESNVIILHRIAFHTLAFSKLFYLSQYDIGELPIINEEYFKCIIRTISKSSKPVKKTFTPLRDQMVLFYSSEYIKFLPERIIYSKITNAFGYMSKEFVTDYSNNIIQNYEGYVKRYFETKFGFSNMDSDERKVFRSDLKKIISDLFLYRENLESPEKYHLLIHYIRSHLLPLPKDSEKPLTYDIKVKPFEYFPSMIHMMKYVEKNSESKLLNPFPMKLKCIPSYITLDTTDIERIFSVKVEKVTKEGEKISLEERKLKIWSSIFNLDKKNFRKKGYEFHYMIKTDGVGCSILFSKKLNCDKTKSKDKYIQDLSDEELVQLKDKKLVGIDPGKSDLLLAQNGTRKRKNGNRKPNIWRYTQVQRRHETFENKHQKELLISKEAIIEYQGINKSVIEWETELSAYNSKTLDHGKFENFLQAKIKLNHILSEFYNESIHRVRKLCKYIGKQKSEAKMIKRFKKEFGAPDKVVIGFGDFKETNHMKYCEPTKGIGFRETFKKAGYKIYLIDEFRTSKMCSDSSCEGICEYTKYKEKEIEGKIRRVPVHGLLKCTTCNKLWNRDVNGSLNIEEILRGEISGAVSKVSKEERRPEKLRRKLTECLTAVSNVIRSVRKRCVRKK